MQSWHSGYGDKPAALSPGGGVTRPLAAFATMSKNHFLPWERSSSVALLQHPCLSAAPALPPVSTGILPADVRSARSPPAPHHHKNTFLSLVSVHSWCNNHHAARTRSRSDAACPTARGLAIPQELVGPVVSWRGGEHRRCGRHSLRRRSNSVMQFPHLVSGPCSRFLPLSPISLAERERQPASMCAEAQCSSYAIIARTSVERGLSLLALSSCIIGFTCPGLVTTPIIQA